VLSTEDYREEKYFSNNYYPVFDENNSVISIVVFAQEITERKQAEEHIYHLSNFDAMTGLPNRQKLLMDLEQSQPSGCAIFNIDNFKELNDFFGISSGDILLRVVGEWFKSMGFSPYRIGGDEFALLFHEYLTPEKLHLRMSALMSALDDERFIVENETLDVRMSAGAAIGSHKLLTRADIALHTAKERKIPIAFYEESENVEKQYHTNIAMATTIRKALANGRIFCHYQPIVNIATGKVDKYETLVRMIDEDKNIIMPMQFLPIAKKTKLYPRITKEVLHQACHLFASRNEEFSINLSIDDIHDSTTVQDILSTMTQTGTASRIVFEILESDGVENYDEVVHFIDQVKKLGAKIAIDDFGTGYSNFERILQLNVDYIKIDGSLIREIADNPRHQIIVETIVDFAKKMGAQTIAEFVSDERIFQTIKGYGIDYSQGYYTGKPEAIE
jgi:diguanylate cyclase (GGDEF)-like protein